MPTARRKAVIAGGGAEAVVRVVVPEATAAQAGQGTQAGRETQEAQGTPEALAVPRAAAPFNRTGAES